MPPKFDPNAQFLKYFAPSHGKLLTDLEKFHSKFRWAESMRHLQKLHSSGDYLDGLHEIITKIKDYRITKGFNGNGELKALKNFPTDLEELDLCKKSLEVYYKKICFLYSSRSLGPKIVNDKALFNEKFQKVSEQLLYQSSYDLTTFEDVALFYAYTLIQILEKLGVNMFEEKVEDDIVSAVNFELENDLSTRLTYNILKENKFIGESNDFKTFDLIFRKGRLVNKINWIGKANELARFVYFLHTNITDKNHMAVCKDTEQKFQKAADCFTINGYPVESDKLSNNNRSLKNKEREQFLLTAIFHLYSPPKNTLK